MASKPRNHLRQFPIRRITSLIKLAIENDLEALELGDIKIVPRKRDRRPIPTNIEGSLELFEREEKKKGEPLTDQEKTDIALFGPGGIIREEDGY